MKKVVIMIIVISLFLAGCSQGAAPVNKPLPQATEAGKTQADSDILASAANTPTSEPTAPPTPTASPVPTPEPIPEPTATPEPTPVSTPKPEPPILPENGYSNAKKGWYYNPNKDHEPPTAQRDIDLSLFDAFYLGNTDNKEIYLTFDAGYENGYTPGILDTLKEKNVPAAFFVLKSYMRGNEDLVRRMVEEGHIVGNHSATHPSLPDLSDEDIVYEIEETARYFKEITGEEMPRYFRPPSGEYSERVLYVTRMQDYRTVFWSFAYEDWKVDAQPGADYAYRKVMDHLHNGSIMLLHTVSQSNAEALSQMIDSAREQGYVFKSLDEL